MPRWSEKTLRASEQQERRRATTARASAAISVSVPFSPSFLNNNNVGEDTAQFFSYDIINEYNGRVNTVR